MKEIKEAKLTIRLYAREKEILKEIAEKAGVPISEIVRGLIEEYIARESSK